MTETTHPDRTPKPGLVTRHGSHHHLPCPMCHRAYDLFAAPWCGHMHNEPSKLCPHCEDCSCTHPAYDEPYFWTDPSAKFRANGFDRPFLFYI